MLQQQLANFLSRGAPREVELTEDMQGTLLYERDPMFGDPGKPCTYREWFLYTDLRHLWSNLANLGNIYEEICREWYLPTWLGVSVAGNKNELRGGRRADATS